jgi:hypothetical protein
MAKAVANLSLPPTRDMAPGDFDEADKLAQRRL